MIIIAKLKNAIGDTPIDVVIHNAGGAQPISEDRSKDLQGREVFTEQSFDSISTKAMSDTFNLNALSVVRVQQALTDKMSEGGKVLIISTGMGSINDNNSGGLYAYRASKAALNMIGKNMSCDLKSKGIYYNLFFLCHSVTNYL